MPLIEGSYLGGLLEALGLCLANKICLSSGYGACQWHQETVTEWWWATSSLPSHSRTESSVSSVVVTARKTQSASYQGVRKAIEHFKGLWILEKFQGKGKITTRKTIKVGLWATVFFFAIGGRESETSCTFVIKSKRRGEYFNWSIIYLQYYISLRFTTQ